MGSFQHIGHVNAAEKIHHLGLSSTPYVLHLAVVEDAAIVVLPLDTLVEAQGTFDGLDDIEKRNLFRQPRERVATMSALLRFDQAVIREQGKNLRQERLGNVFRLGNLADTSVAIVGEPSTIDDCPKGIVTLAGEL